jgi:hypothetical protein
MCGRDHRRLPARSARPAHPAHRCNRPCRDSAWTIFPRRHWRLAPRANFTRSPQGHQITAFLNSHGVAIVDPQSGQQGTKKERDPKKGNPSMRRTVEQGGADDREYRTSERESGPPACPQGAREASTTRYLSARNGRRARYDGILVAQPYAHGDLLCSALRHGAHRPCPGHVVTRWRPGADGTGFQLLGIHGPVVGSARQSRPGPNSRTTTICSGGLPQTRPD